MHYVYILLSQHDNNFYIGSTSDLRRRITEHERGAVTATKYRLPVTLVCYEAYRHKHEAQRREKFLKSSDGRKDLRKRLDLAKVNGQGEINRAVLITT